MHAINSRMLDNAVKNFEEIEFSNEDTLQNESLHEEVDSSHETDDEEEFIPEIKPKDKRSYKVNSTALPWTTEEIKAVERRLHKFLQLQKTPGKKDREEATSKEKVLNNRSWEKYKNIQCL